MSDLIRSHTEPQPDSRASRRSFLKLAGIGGAVLVAAGCDTNATDPIDPGGFGTLSGTVVDSEGNAPLGNVNVMLEGTSRSAVTAEDGTFTIENLPARTFTVIVSTNGFETAMEEVTVPNQGSATANITLTPGGPLELDFSDDFGVLNFAFALEQIEAAFYTQVIATPYGGMTAAETALLTDIRDHEIAHREFFRANITQRGRRPIRGLRLDFSTVDFSNRTSVLETAQTLEDLGVAAYNGAGAIVLDEAALINAGEIVSVEARHAAVIRDILDNPGDPLSSLAFAPAAFDEALAPPAVLAAAAPFIVNETSATGL